MTDFYHDDPIENQAPKRKKNSVFAALALVGMAGLYLQTTFAANISLNAGSAIEFGQGVTRTTACDNSVTLTPLRSFVNASGAGSFLFSGVTISNLDTTAQGCAGKTLSMASYGDTGASLSTFSVSIASDGSFTSSDGTLSNTGSQGSASNLTLTFTSPSVNTSAVYKITMQSGLSAPVATGSIYLNNAWLSAPYTADLNVGATGAFTMEMWAKPTTNNVYQGLYTGGPNGGQLGYFDDICSSTNNMFVGVWGESCNFFSGPGQYPVINQWNHIVLERDGSNNNSVYLNGTRIINSVGSIKLGINASYGLIIGKIERGNFTGYISNFRLVKGSALYSGTTITVPTSPLTLAPPSGTVSSLLLMKTDAGLFTDETGVNTYSSSANTRTATPSATSGTYSFSSDSPFS